MEMIPVFIVLIVFSSVLVVVKMGLDYKRSKLLAPPDSGGGSLRTSELEALIQRAVEKSVKPILDRFEETERRLCDHDVLLLDEAQDIDPPDTPEE